MKASVLCLFFLVTGAVTVTHVQPTAAPMTTHSQPTIILKTTHSHPTTAPKTTHSHPTTAPKTTHSHPTTAPKTTHNYPTTAAKTTHSQPTTAPKTTHSKPTQPTTAPKTTHSHPTTAPKTTAHRTPGNTTKSPAHTTAAAGNTTANATGTTIGTTTPAPTTIPRPENIIPSYQFKNGSEICMLFVLDATLKIKYNTTNGTAGEVTIPVSGKLNGVETNWTTTSSCEFIVQRVFQIAADYPAVPGSSSAGKVSLDFQFGIFGQPPYGISALVTGTWTYAEPLFPRNTENYGKRTWEARQWNMGTMGNAFGCQKVTLTREPLTIILDHVMMQPFAERANHTFGKVEECIPTTMAPTTAMATSNVTTGNATTAPTHHPPTKPSPNNGGMIAGIVIGVLILVAIIIGVAVLVVRKRRLKQVAYGKMDDDHKDYVH